MSDSAPKKMTKAEIQEAKAVARNLARQFESYLFSMPNNAGEASVRELRLGSLIAAYPAVLTHIEERHLARYVMEFQKDLGYTIDLCERGLLSPNAVLRDQIDLGHYAAAQGRMDVLQWLWDNQKDFGYTQAHWGSILKYGVQMDGLDAEAIDWFVAKDVDINWLDDNQNGFGTTPLYGAATHGNVLVLERLLAHGADPDLAGARGDRPIMMALRHGLAFADRLIDAGADLNVFLHEDDGTPSMGLACFAGHEPEAMYKIRHLISRGLDVTRDPQLLLVAANRGGHIGPEDIHYLVSLGCDPNRSAVMEKSWPLKRAVEHQNPLAVKTLIEAGADIRKGEGELLAVAALNNDMDMFRLLYRHGARVPKMVGDKTFRQAISRASADTKRAIASLEAENKIASAFDDLGEAVPVTYRPAAKKMELTL